ncbi:MAG: substrate-binding domain-containing protein [Oscillospiraceae bacterium]
MKKTIFSTVALILSTILLASCAKGGNDSITVISREDGSGTRGAFIELFGIQEKDANGKAIDKTIDTADINNSTGIVLTNVSSNKNSIGYVSLGALNDSVKALKIDGAEATVENIKNGTYKIHRPFNVATKENISDIAKDFLEYILSTEGQEVVVNNGYIALDNTKSYVGANKSGKITVAGSSSVTPVMEKLKESYIKLNPNVDVQIQENDSTTGMNSAIEGVCDIGMASRELKESEISKGLKATTIAIDGIAVIANKENKLNDISKQQVKNIYTGVFANWSEV